VVYVKGFPVLKDNMYDLASGEPSVFEHELGTAGEAGSPEAAAQTGRLERRSVWGQREPGKVGYSSFGQAAGQTGCSRSDWQVTVHQAGTCKSVAGQASRLAG
jgi:hypothetical protein